MVPVLVAPSLSRSHTSSVLHRTYSDPNHLGTRSCKLSLDRRTDPRTMAPHSHTAAYTSPPSLLVAALRRAACSAVGILWYILSALAGGLVPEWDPVL
jgi:hypothetical protein